MEYCYCYIMEESWLKRFVTQQIYRKITQMLTREAGIHMDISLQTKFLGTAQWKHNKISAACWKQPSDTLPIGADVRNGAKGHRIYLRNISKSPKINNISI